MAARGVRLRHTLLAATLALTAALSTFQLKYAVRDLELELGAQRARLAAERSALQLARADLAYLVRPERLVAQAGELRMVPGGGSRIVDVTGIVPAELLRLAREPLLALLPSGAEGLLRVKPLPPGVMLAATVGRAR